MVGGPAGARQGFLSLAWTPGHPHLPLPAGDALRCAECGAASLPPRLPADPSDTAKESHTHAAAASPALSARHSPAAPQALHEP